MTTRSGMTLKRLQGPPPRSRRSVSIPGGHISDTMYIYLCITRLFTVHNIVMVETISCVIITIYVKKLKSQWFFFLHLWPILDVYVFIHILVCVCTHKLYICCICICVSEFNIILFFFYSFFSAVKQEFHFEEDNYYTEDEYMEEGEEEEEEEDVSSSPEKGSKKKGRGRANGEPRMKMRRIFRITHGRERQRGEEGKRTGSFRFSQCHSDPRAQLSTLDLGYKSNYSALCARLISYFFCCFNSSSSLPIQSKIPMGFCSVIRRYWPLTRGWGACLELSRSTVWTETPWPPPPPSLSSCWSHQRRSKLFSCSFPQLNLNFCHLVSCNSFCFCSYIVVVTFLTLISFLTIMCNCWEGR